MLHLCVLGRRERGKGLPGVPPLSPPAGQARHCVSFTLQPPHVNVSYKAQCNHLDASSPLQGEWLTDSTPQSDRGTLNWMGDGGEEEGQMASRTQAQKPTKGFWVLARFRLKLLPTRNPQEESILTQKGIPKE